jgi:membrane fusion protein, multidrug efflux system
MKRKTVITLIIVFVAVALGFALLSAKLKGSKSSAGVPGGAPGAPAQGGMPGNGQKPPAGTVGNAQPGDETRAAKNGYSVKASVVELRNMQSYLEVNGDVQAETKVDVYSDIGGRLVSLTVELGSRVSKGQLIAEIDPSKPGAKYSLSGVYAPISGTITALNYFVGSTIGMNSSIATVGKIDQLEIIAKVSERDVGSLRAGQAAKASFAAFPGEVFPLTLYKLNPVIDSVSRSKEIRLKFNKADPRVNAGMFAKLVIYTDMTPDCVTIPQEAILERNNQQLVFVVKDDDNVEKRVIVSSKTIDGTTIVTEGLTPGEKVVIAGNQVLADGSAVIVVNAAQLQGGKAK